MPEEYGDDLAVIFVESQGANAKRAESCAYDRGWMGRGAYWTLERPASTGLGYLPSFILLDVDGKVLLKGNTGSMKGKIKDAIKDQIKDARDLPEEYGKDFKKAWKALGSTVATPRPRRRANRAGTPAPPSWPRSWATSRRP